MDPVRTLLDRELLLSAIVHELRGPITAVQFALELDEEGSRPALEATVERLAGLVTTLSDTAVQPPAVVEFRGHAIFCRGPPQVLDRALALLPHRTLDLEVHPEHLALTIQGVPAEELAAGWSLAQVRRWLAEGGPGLAGARMRIAARIVGALRYSFQPGSGEAEGVVTIHLARG